MVIHGTISDAGHFSAGEPGGSMYLGQAFFRVAFLPSRVAYLVKAGSRAGFVRAVREATTRWAGATEPIIPVRRGGRIEPWWRQVAELASIDVVVNVDVEGSDADSAAAVLGKPLVAIARIDRMSKSAFSVHPLNLPRSSPNASPAVLARPGASLWEVVACGDVTPEHEAELAAADRTWRRAESPEDAGRAQIRNETALDDGLRYFAENAASGGPWPRPSLVFAARRTGLRDCWFYWNIRALRSLDIEPFPMFILPAQGIERWVGFADRLSSVLRRSDQFSPDVLMAGFAPMQALDSLAEVLGLSRTQEEPRSGFRTPTVMREPPFTYTTNLDPRDSVVFERDYGLLADFDFHLLEASTSISLQSPIPFSSPGSLLLRIRSEAFDGLPRRPSVARRILPEACWVGEALEVATDARQRYRFRLQIPHLDDALGMLLDDSGAVHALSDKGRIGVALMDQLDINKLGDRAIFDCVRELTTPRSKSLYAELARSRTEIDGELADIAARYGGRTGRRSRTVSDLRSVCGPKALAAAETLAAAEWVERGLLIECARCGVSSFLALSEASGTALCPGCGSAESFRGSPTGLDVHYRLNTFVDRASEQGVVPHLVVIAALRRMYRKVHVLPGVQVTPPDTTFELDVVGIADGLMAAGEVKTSGSDFSPPQVRSDIVKSIRIGADIHVMAAMDHIPNEARDLAAGLCLRNSMELLVMGPEELFA